MNKAGSTGAIQLAVNKNLNGHGIFWQNKEKTKLVPKKIDYKTRRLRHPLRQPNDDEVWAQIEAQKEEEKKKFNKENKDFIRKNRERFKDRGHDYVPDGTHITPGTVTLTQEQLNALLASLGKPEPVKIKFDATNNKIELEKLEDDAERNSSEKKAKKVQYTEDKAELGIGALLEAEKTKEKRFMETNKALPPGNSTMIVASRKEAQDELVPPNVPWKHMTVAERKRLQWARERAEYEGEYNPWGKPGAGAPPMRKETETSQAVDNQITARTLVDPEMKRKQDVIVREIAQLQKEIQEMEKKKKQEEERMLKELIKKSSLPEARSEVPGERHTELVDHTGHTYKARENSDQRAGAKEVRKQEELHLHNVSSMERHTKDDVQTMTNGSPQLMTGPATGLKLGDGQEELLSKKEQERRKWVAELDKQREEQRMKKQLEKEREKNGPQDQWADRFVYHKTLEQISPRHAQVAEKKTLQTVNPSHNSSADDVTEKYIPPAAMRSSMMVGAGGLNEQRYDGAKAEEKRKWLQELEAQRQEQRLAKLAQKEKDKKEEDGTWADHYPSDHHKAVPDSRNIDGGVLEENPHTSNRKGAHALSEDNRGIWMDPYPSDYKKLQHIPDQSSSEGQTRTTSAPSSTVPATVSKETTDGPSFLRGQGNFVDPVTRQEQEEKRKAQLAYQAQVKAQIEEKERKKKEEKMKKMQEDLEEEKKLQMERDKMNRQTEHEQRKLREREELRQKQINVLKSAMDEAQEKAMEERMGKRLHHLEQHGHDVTQLKAKYGDPVPSMSKVLCPLPSFTSMTTPGCSSASPRKKEFDVSTIPGLAGGHFSRVDGSSSPPPYPVAVNRQDDHRAHGHEPYVEDRVLTPSMLRDTVSMAGSPRREFGTQTFDLKDLKAILEKLPEEVQIEYKMKLEKALIESGKEAPSRKVHIKKTEEPINKAVKAIKSAPKEKTVNLNERPDWNQRKRKTVVKNSEKDPFYEQKKAEAEARRLKRERQLVYLQELNKERIPNLSKSPGRSPRDKSPEVSHLVAERGRNPGKIKGHQQADPSPVEKDSRKKKSPASPPVPAVKRKDPYAPDPYSYVNNYLRSSHGDTKYGDVPLDPSSDEFMPFMRTTEILDPSKADEPMEFSRENSRMERARQAYFENLHPAAKGKKVDIYQDREREIALKGKQNLMGATYVTPRQDMILQQLSSLKKTLMDRQKELEDYMLPSELENLRG